MTTTGRGTAIGEGVTWTARWSLRLILASAGVVLVWLLVAQLWSIVFPVLLAVIIATLLWPPTGWLRRHRFPPALAAATSLVAALAVVGGLITLVGTSVAGSVPQIAQSVSGGITAIQQWLSGPPLNLGRSQLDGYITQITTQIQQSISTISTSVLAGISGIASGLVTFVLALVLVFLFVKDGPRFLPWVRKVAGIGAGGHIAELLGRIWVTLGSFVRAQAIVSLVDAVLIGGGLLIVGVPLALPLAVLTFLGASSRSSGRSSRARWPCWWRSSATASPPPSSSWWSCSPCSRSRATSCSRSCRPAASGCTRRWCCWRSPREAPSTASRAPSSRSRRPRRRRWWCGTWAS